MSSQSVKMGELSHPILLVSLPTPEERSRSISPNSTSSTGELKGIKLFRAIGRKLSRRRNTDGYESTDSEPSSSSEGHSDSGSGNNSPDSMSKDNSTIRKVLNSLNLKSSSDRRSSDSNSEVSSSSSSRKKSSSSSTPKKILRQPVSYTYVRGLSGLPTIRVPRTNACCAQSCCRCHTPGCGR